MMLVFASTLVFLFHTCQAQFSCSPSTCDSFPNRELQTGCRTFCTWADTQGWFVTSASLHQRFDSLRDPIWDDIDRSTFVSDFVAATGMCATEASDLFDFITALGEGDPDFIQTRDVDALWEYLQSGQEDNQAQCVITDDTGVPDQAISGLVMYSQSPAGGDVSVDIDIQGFDPNDGEPKHGFHVHANPSTGSQCGDSGGHYNPFNVDHAAPWNVSRHVGDLGNIEENPPGRVVTTLVDRVISLRTGDGQYYIIDRANNVHAQEDDLGLGGDEGSRASGNAGPRIGCCVIQSFDATTAVSRRGFGSSWELIYTLVEDPLCFE